MSAHHLSSLVLCQPVCLRRPIPAGLHRQQHGHCWCRPEPPDLVAVRVAVAGSARWRLIAEGLEAGTERRVIATASFEAASH